MRAASSSWLPRVAWMLTGAFAIAAALSSSATAGAKDSPKPLLVFAAASLRNALDAIDAQWQAQGHAGASISYAASSALAKQIENGAPADVFWSADSDWMGYLGERALLRDGTRADVLGNRLVLIAPSASNAELAIAPGFALASALGDGRMAIAEPDSVPAGKYARAALQTLVVWDSVSSRLAPTENARAALALVARGEAPLGIVYRSDAQSEPAVRIVATFPEDSHPRIVYPVAIVRTSVHPDAAAFVAFVQTPAARAIFAKHGFIAAASRDR